MTKASVETWVDGKQIKVVQFKSVEAARAYTLLHLGMGEHMLIVF